VPVTFVLGMPAPAAFAFALTSFALVASALVALVLGMFALVAFAFAPTAFALVASALVAFVLMAFALLAFAPAEHPYLDTSVGMDLHLCWPVQPNPFVGRTALLFGIDWVPLASLLLGLDILVDRLACYLHCLPTLVAGQQLEFEFVLQMEGTEQILLDIQKLQTEMIEMR